MVVRVEGYPQSPVALRKGEDYFLWGICEAEILRVKPKTLDDLKEVVSDFMESLDEEEVRRAA